MHCELRFLTRRVSTLPSGRKFMFPRDTAVGLDRTLNVVLGFAVVIGNAASPEGDFIRD
jgi:hypothetical protein